MFNPEEFEAWKRRMWAERDEQRAALAEAFGESPAVVIEQRDRDTLLILSGDMRRGHGFRVSIFDVDGPRTHVEGDNAEEAIEEARQEIGGRWSSVTPLSEEEVSDWTTTEQFIDGSKRVLFVQAVNRLLWICNKDEDAAEWAISQKSDAESLIDTAGWDAALDAIESAVRQAQNLCSPRATEWS